MAFTFDTAGINLAADGLAAGATHAEIWDGDPTAGGVKTSNERGAVVLTNTNGTLTIDATEAFTGAPGAGATHVVLFDDPAAGNRVGYGDLTGDQAFNAAGDYDLTGVTLTVQNTP